MEKLTAVRRSFISPFVQEKDFDFTGGYCFEKNGSAFLLNPDVGSSILLDRDHLEEIKNKKISDDLQFKLIQRGFMKVPGSPQCTDEESILPRFFIIDLTQACNFRCTYCFRHLDETPRTISNETLQSIIDFIADYCKKTNQREIHIQPWGGEPLIAWKKILHIHDDLQEKGIKAVLTIESNAGLITPRVAKEAYERDIRIGVSIDGLPEIHNLQRKLANGKDSFEKMRQGMQNLRDAGYGTRHGIITVLTRNTLPYLEEFLEYFAIDLKIDRFKLNIVKDSPVMKDKGLCLSNAEIIDFQKRLLKKLIELNKRGHSIIELNVFDKLQNLLIRNKGNICISRGCLGGKKMIAFDMDGRIFPCDITDYKEEAVGSVNDGEELIPLLEKAHHKTDFFAKKESENCASCPWWFFCKGGCTTAIKYKKGKVEGVDELECLSNRSLYPELIRMFLEEPELVKILTKNKLEIA